jgi:FkbH-like protein
MIDSIEHNRLKFEILRTTQPHKVIQLMQKQFLQNGNTVNIKIIRNTVAEHIIEWIEIYAKFAGIKLQKKYSDYDDSLSFNHLTKDDIIIYVIDFSRYNLLDKKFIGWFTSNIVEKLKITESKIIILGRINSLDNLNILKFKRLLKKFCSNQEISVFIEDLNSAKQDLSKVSKQIVLKDKNHEIAKKIGLKIIPGLNQSQLRLIILDLDNTLYKGILSEDGLSGLELTKNHKKLFKLLKKYKDKGMLLAVASKNDEKDVLNLVKSNFFSPLSLEDFVSIKANWLEKSVNIKEIIDEVNFSSEYSLFLDDNTSEILKVKNNFNEIEVLLADDINLVLKLLTFHPRISLRSKTFEDQVRNEDIIANKKRRELQKKSNSESSFELMSEVSIIEATKSIQDRLFELSNKTNQFNSNNYRISKQELDDLIGRKLISALGISLKDSFSNSGLIGFVAAKVENKSLIVFDLCLSCRALGRNLESVMIFKSLEYLAKNHFVDEIIVKYTQTEKNLPFKVWISNYLEEMNHEYRLSLNTLNEIEYDKMGVTLNYVKG